MKKPIYISGKISDGDKEKRKFDKFFKKEEELVLRGYENILNPARWGGEDWTWEQCIVRDFDVIIKNKPTMYMMKGWKGSQGARLEHEMALLLKLTIIYE